MDKKDGLKSLKITEPPKDLDYRLSMSLKQPEDNYVVDELFRHGTITIYALYDVDRKLAKPKNEQVGDGTDFLENDGDHPSHGSSILYKNSHFKKFWKSNSSKHVQGDKSERKIQTDLECEGKNSEDLKILYSRHSNNGGRRRNDNAVIKKKSGSGEILNDGGIVSNSAVKKFESNLVKVPEEPEVENKNVEDEILLKKNVHKPKKELKFSGNRTDVLIDPSVQNCILNDMKYLQLQINRIITKLEESNGVVKSNSDLPKKKSIQKQEVTVRLSMEQNKSSVVLTGSVFSISEGPKKSDSAIEISSQATTFGGSKSESNSSSPPVENSVKKSLSFDENAKSPEVNFKKEFETSVLVTFEYQMTKGLMLLESYNEYNKIYIEVKKTEDKKPGRIPIFKSRNVLSKYSRLPWNSSTQKNDLSRRSLINKTNSKPPSRKKEIDSKQSISMESKKKSISAMKRTTDQIPSVKVIHSNRSYLDLLKTPREEEQCKRQITPRAFCVRNQKSAKQSLREVPKSNYIILPHTVYEKVIFVRDGNSKDEFSSDFDESLSGKTPSCSCVLGSKSEESQPPVKTTSKDEITLMGKQSLPEIKIRKKEFRELSKRGSDGFQKEKDNSQVVRSIWALTKVLIFDDGSKKMEVLEASCTPLLSNLKQISTA